MKKLLTLLFIGILTTIYVMQCNNSTKSDTKGADDLVGVWYIKSAETEFVITTNSDQKTADQNSEGNGGIELTGDINETFKYLSNFEGELFVTDQPLGSDDVEYTGAIMYFTESAIIFAKYDYENPSAALYYGTEYAEYSYNPESMSLTVSPTPLYKLDVTTGQIDSTAIINVEGTLQSKIIELKANKPTTIDYLAGIEAFEDNTVFTFNEDRTWESTSYDEDGEQYQTGGTWEENDGKLTVTEIDSEEEDVVIEMEYDFDDDDLEITFETNFCELFIEEDESITECYYFIEEMLAIESGSIENAVMDVEIEFTPTPSAMGKKNRAIHPELLPLLKQLKTKALIK